MASYTLKVVETDGKQNVRCMVMVGGTSPQKRRESAKYQISLPALP